MNEKTILTIIAISIFVIAILLNYYFILRRKRKAYEKLRIPLVGIIILIIPAFILWNALLLKERPVSEIKIEFSDDDVYRFSNTDLNKLKTHTEKQLDSLKKNYSVYKTYYSTASIIRNDTIVLNDTTLRFKNENAYNSHKDSLLDTQRKLEFIQKIRDDEQKQVKVKEFVIYTVIILIAIIVLGVFISLISNISGNSSKFSMRKLLDEKVKEGEIYKDIAEKQKKINLYNWFYDIYLKNNLINDKPFLYNEKIAQHIKPVFEISEELEEDKRNVLLSSLNSMFSAIKNNSEPNKETEIIKSVLNNEKHKERLENESEKLSKQARINMLICFTIAIFMVLLLAFILLSPVITDKTHPESFIDFLITFLPRLVSIIGLGSVFLYFINLYKSNMHDVKYFQNELTNIDLKETGLKLAIQTNNLTPETIKSFTETERNKVIKSDETTSELERLKVEKDVNKEFLDKLWNFMKFKDFDNQKDKEENK